MKTKVMAAVLKVRMSAALLAQIDAQAALWGVDRSEAARDLILSGWLSWRRVVQPIPDRIVQEKRP